MIEDPAIEIAMLLIWMVKQQGGMVIVPNRALLVEEVTGYRLGLDPDPERKQAVLTVVPITEET